MSDLATWLLQLVNDYGYFGAFLASLIGNMSEIIRARPMEVPHAPNRTAIIPRARAFDGLLLWRL